VRPRPTRRGRSRHDDIWARVIMQEEAQALDRHALRITPLLEEGQHDSDSPKGEEEDAARFGKRKRRAAGGDEGAGNSEMQQMRTSVTSKIARFGSGFMTDSSGVFLHDRLMRWSTPHVNLCMFN
jgi:hypothetical protein